MMFADYCGLINSHLRIVVFTVRGIIVANDQCWCRHRCSVCCGFQVCHFSFTINVEKIQMYELL